MAKSKLKMIKYLSFFKLNEIHIVDGPLNKDSKIQFFSREALISWEGRPENLGKMGNNRDIIAYPTSSHGIWRFIPHRGDYIPRSEADFSLGSFPPKI